MSLHVSKQGGVRRLAAALVVAMAVIGGTFTAANANPLPTDASTSKVSGVVTGSNGSAASNARVELFQWDETAGQWPSSSLDSRTTGGDGAFGFLNLPKGRYTLRYTPAAGSGDLQQWWGGKPSDAKPDGFDLGDIDLDCSYQLKLGGTVSGRVTTKSGSAIANTEVLLFRQDSQVESKTVVTDANGNYTIAGIYPGSWLVELSGSTDSTWFEQWWNDADYRGDATPLSISYGSVITGVDAHLESQSKISGRILDPNGNPLSGFRVAAWSPTGGPWNEVASRTTNASGDFTILGLRAGQHRLAITDPSGGTSKYPYRWWKDASSATSAQLIDVPTQGELKLGDMRLTRLITVRAKAIAGGSSPAVGQALQASVTVDDDLRPQRAYQWLRDGKVISGESNSTYSPKASDLGAQISARVQLSGPNLVAKTVDIDLKTPVRQGEFKVIKVPVLTGNAGIVGSVFSVQGASWLPTPDRVTYQWTRDGAPLSGRTSASYTTTNADAGTQLGVTVTVSADGYLPTTHVLATSPSGGELNKTPAPTVSYSGQIATGALVTAQPGRWDSNVKLSYQWQNNKKSIKGATSATYRVRASDVGDKIRARVTGTKPGFTPITRYSPTLVPAKARFASITPTVAGVRAVGNTLTAHTAWPSRAKLKYQWLRNGHAIAGATKSRYLLTASDLTGRLRVKVTASAAGYQTRAMASGSTRPVARGTITSHAVSISGTPRTGSTLTAARGTWRPASVVFSYAWYRDGASIAGATGRTYKVTAADRGHAVTVRVTGTKPGYATARRTSAAVSVSR